MYAGGNTDVNNADHIVQHLAMAKPTAARAGLYHMLTEWGGSWMPGNGVGVGSGQGNGTGGSVNPDSDTAAGWHGEQQDTHETAAFILQVILRSHEAGLVWGTREATSYWDLTDVFEEAGFPTLNSSFHGGFGLINVYGVPKPAYRAYQLLHELGDQLLVTQRTGGGSRTNPADCTSTVGVLASKSNASCLSVLLFSQATRGAPIPSSCTIKVTVSSGTNAGTRTRTTAHVYADMRTGTGNEGTASDVVYGTIRRIDAAHTAPKEEWVAMGMPQWPSREQNQRIFAASVMQKEKLPVTKTGGGS